MEIVLVLLILINMTNLGSFAKQVSVLKYKGGEECLSALVGVQIKPAPSLLDEFTFCGKFYFRFLRPTFLMAIEPDLILKIIDFEKRNGDLFYQNAYHWFNFYNHTITPDSWQYICLAISSIQTKIVWNGEILFSNPKVDVSKEKIKVTKIWLGGALFFDWETNRRFEGMIAKAEFWNIALQDDDLISITTNDKPIISSTKYDLLSSTTTSKNSSCIDYLILDENDVLFQGSLSENHLIEYKTDFQSSNYMCEGYGGNLTLPKNEEDMKTLGNLIQQSEVCEFPFLGLKKSGNEEIVDLEGNPVYYLKWHLNQPNGGETQLCINTWDSYVNDVPCDKKRCFFCQIPEKTLFILRGPIPTNTDRKYFVTMSRKLTEIRGVTKTECFWNNGTWYFGKNLKLDNATNNVPPTGLKTWNNGQKFKFTLCKKDEFTCHTFGHCIPMNKRCDGIADCPVDGSDENECKLMMFDKGYDEKYPSKMNIACFITVLVHNIIDIDELHMSYTIDFTITMKWFDSRIVFGNLKPTQFGNYLDNLEIEKIWTPKLYFNHSANLYMKAGHQSEGISGNVFIIREGSPQDNGLLEINEDYLYPGGENPIRMVNYYVIKLGCEIDLKWYGYNRYFGI